MFTIRTPSESSFMSAIATAVSWKIPCVPARTTTTCAAPPNPAMPNPFAGVGGDERRDRSAVTGVVVPVVHRPRRQRPVGLDGPERVDLPGQVGDVVRARVDDADDHSRVALHALERAVGVRRGELPLIGERCGWIGRVGERVSDGARRAPQDAERLDVRRGVAVRALEERVQLRRRLG
jgi:hypothetical protein